MNQSITYNRVQTFWLVTLRVIIGWHFLYEGLVKFFNSNWTSYHFLLDSQGWFSSIFYSLAENPTAVSVVNFLNVYGLIFIGLGLILGCFSRWASVAGVFLLAVYFLSHPPFIGATYIMPSEGSFLWIDKNIIEICALMVLIYFPTSHIIGLDRFIGKFCKCKKA